MKPINRIIIEQKDRALNVSKILLDITCHRFKLLTGQEMDEMHHCAIGSREAHDDLTFPKNRAIRQEVQTNKQTKNYDLWSFKMFQADLQNDGVKNYDLWLFKTLVKTLKICEK